MAACTIFQPLNRIMGMTAIGSTHVVVSPWHREVRRLHTMPGTPKHWATRELTTESQPGVSFKSQTTQSQWNTLGSLTQPAKNNLEEHKQSHKRPLFKPNTKPYQFGRCLNTEGKTGSNAGRKWLVNTCCHACHTSPRPILGRAYTHTVG